MFISLAKGQSPLQGILFDSAKGMAGTALHPVSTVKGIKDYYSSMAKEKGWAYTAGDLGVYAAEAVAMRKAVKTSSTKGSNLRYSDEFINSKTNNVKNNVNGVGNPVNIENHGSTGRTSPHNLNEQMAMHEVRANPRQGAKELKLPLSDSRWPASEGWVKMQRVVTLSDGTKIVIHFNYNKITGVYDDFKFK